MTDAFDELPCWRDAHVARRLGWYRDVALNRKPAKFRIAQTIPVALTPEGATEDALWRELDRMTPTFVARWHAIRSGRAELGTTPPGPNLLGLCRELTRRMLTHCNFCRWDCGVDRTTGTKFGTCKLAAETRVSTFFHHPGEELVYRGRLGSGTIFFTSCNMRWKPSGERHHQFIRWRRGPDGSVDAGKGFAAPPPDGSP